MLGFCENREQREIQNHGDCQFGCHEYLRLNTMIMSSNIPNIDKYLWSKIIPMTKIEQEAFCRLEKIKENIIDFVSDGKNLLITSEHPQTGKTTWALRLMFRYFYLMRTNLAVMRRGFFIFVPELLLSFESYGFKNSDDRLILDEIIKNTDLIIWDDLLLNHKLTESDIKVLQNYIHQRILLGKANIFTGVSLPDVEEFIGKDIAYIVTSGEHFNFDGESIKTRRKFIQEHKQKSE